MGHSKTFPINKKIGKFVTIKHVFNSVIARNLLNTPIIYNYREKEHLRTFYGGPVGHALKHLCHTLIEVCIVH